MTMETSKTYSRILDSDSCLVWLDRSYKDLLQLKRNLGSYLFEPTTSKQFEIKQQLSDSMEALVHRHLELVRLARSGRQLLAKQIEMIKNYVTEAKKLEDRIYEYMGMTQTNL
ncbi:hypothetical protein PP182_06970 [Maribacter sp. PR1]|uniref:Four helix bundle protein n=1 Tax=Maribacter cobaltidurans TaxID=1178778 RepID=A0ABU7IS72_9FLAO|nr:MULTISPECIES: hypothetical protein [Maribacter]MDC6388416.1 hypothetical protein [Maribacter sp. PR1]MEE1975805.1 hypothetical protein [Maribacter cobaltidurans]